MTPKPSARIAEIRERLIEAQVEKTQRQIFERGHSPMYLGDGCGLIELVDKDSITLQAIIEYLDERDAEEKQQ